ncbi:nucleotidyltransferase domain-containing protein [Candidatus Colwellia aromaticivorans]|uniref:nucleotidyltransferase domain-containing protein n=1 Tax=Candidatus Colwellia aromaticivorans TaxID=2267621 RepID=UPI000DF265DA|nr:nucleotidyltransferase domain-containing protein [Candidatus Colwellia aromaticivorans]
MFGLPNTAIEQMNNIFSQYPDVEKVIIYGSRAKGNYKNGSDIDLTLLGSNIDVDILNSIYTAIDDILLPYTIDLSIYQHIDNMALTQHIKDIGKLFYLKKQDLL